VAKAGRRTNVGTPQSGGKAALTAKLRGYRSGLEDKVAKQLELQGVKVEYETTKIKYVVPESLHTYTPDFVLPNGIIVETKGRFVVADRKKHLLVQKQYPDLDIRFVFSNSKTKISKGSKTSYADWCNKNGFTFADKEVPEEWLDLSPIGKV
jgi:sugar lactone lactonase YvrE